MVNFLTGAKIILILLAFILKWGGLILIPPGIFTIILKTTKEDRLIKKMLDSVYGKCSDFMEIYSLNTFFWFLFLILIGAITLIGWFFNLFVW